MSKSEILPCWPARPDVDGGAFHRCSFEFVPNSKRPREIYVVFDGQRIAQRGIRLATGEPGWMPLIDGYEVLDEAPDVIAVFFGGQRVH
jgi:hypothetical protein